MALTTPYKPAPRRITLAAGIAQAVYAPKACNKVLIGNASPDDLRVYEDPNDAATYFVVAAGYEKVLEQLIPFNPAAPTFYLYGVQAGTAVLIWL
jgi:hypothetical protein